MAEQAGQPLPHALEKPIAIEPADWPCAPSLLHLARPRLRAGFPEANALIPSRQVARISNPPASKPVVIAVAAAPDLAPADPERTLKEHTA